MFITVYFLSPNSQNRVDDSYINLTFTTKPFMGTISKCNAFSLTYYFYFVKNNFSHKYQLVQYVNVTHLRKKSI